MYEPNIAHRRTASEHDEQNPSSRRRMQAIKQLALSRLKKDTFKYHFQEVCAGSGVLTSQGVTSGLKVGAPWDTELE